MNPQTAVYTEAARTIDEIKEHIETYVVNNFMCDAPCNCIDAPWLNEDYNEDDPEQDENVPSNHSQYCPRYIEAYLMALVKDGELPA